MSREDSEAKMSRRRFLRRTAALGASVTVGAFAPALIGCGAPSAPASNTGDTSNTSNTSPTAGSASGASAGEVVEIQFWKPPHGDDAELFKPLLAEFMQANPNVKVTHNIVPWDSVDQNFTAAFAGGNPPDVFYLPDEWYPKYVRQGQIADLTPQVADLKENYDPSVWNIGTYQGKVYGVPFLGVIHALLLNMSLFEEAGLKAPTTWAEIRAAAKQLTDTNKGVYGIDLPNSGAWTFLVPLLKTGGATVLSDDLTKFTANTPGGVAAWEAALQQIAAEDKSAVPLGFTEDQRTDLAIKGKIAMMWREESTITTQFKKQAPDMKLDVIELPPVEGTDGAPAVWTNVGFMFMAEHSKHKDEAFKLIQFLASKKVQENYVIKGVDLMSPMKGVTSSDIDPVVAKYLSFLPHGVGVEISTKWRDVSQGLQQESQAVMTGQKTAKQALGDLEQASNSVLDGS